MEAVAVNGLFSADVVAAVLAVGHCEQTMTLLHKAGSNSATNTARP